MCRIASFDIGKKNFAQYVEEIDLEHIKVLRTRYKALPTKLQRRVKGNMNETIEVLLDDSCIAATKIQMGVYDLRSERCIENKSKGVDMDMRRNIVNHLDSYAELWETCDIFVIEQQFISNFTPKGRKGPKLEVNVDAIKIGEIVMTWFMVNFPFKEIVHYGSQFKTQILGAPNGLTKHQRKKWSIEKAKEIFTLRGDKEALDQMIKGKLDKQKQDDIADACIQCQAYKYREMIGEF